MLPEIAAEAVHFLKRRDLDKACAVSKWLDALIAQSCAVFPLRTVPSVELFPSWNGFSVFIDGVSRTGRSFSNTDEAVYFVASVIRHSYVERLEVGRYSQPTMTLLPEQWATLIETIRSGAVRQLEFLSVDFSALNSDAFLVAIRCRGLQSLVADQSVVPRRFVTDGLIRSSAAKGMHTLGLINNRSDASHEFSDDVVLDFFFRAATGPGRGPLNLWLKGSGITDMFVSKFFKRLQSHAVVPGRMAFFGAEKQCGLSAYAQYLTPGEMNWMDARYRFPAIGDDDASYYEVLLDERSSHLYMRVSLESHDS